ncbi:11351_t:CDS:2, partial [Ambispora gerdemannii]
AKEAVFMARIMELEQNAEKAKLRDIELNARIMELERLSKESKVIEGNSSINQDQTKENRYISFQRSLPSTVQVQESDISSKIKIPYNQKIEQGIIQEVILFIQKEKLLTLSDVKASSFRKTNISETHDSNVKVNNNKDRQELAQLFSDTKIAEGKTIKAKQKKIIYWYTYRKAYQNNIADI